MNNRNQGLVKAAILQLKALWELEEQGAVQENAAYWLGICYMDLFKWSTAVRWLKKALERDPYHYAQIKLCSALVYQSNLEEVVAVLKHLVTYPQVSKGTFNRLAYFLLLQGDLQGAQQSAIRTLQMGTDSAYLAYWILAQVASDKKNHQHALANFEQARNLLLTNRNQVSDDLAWHNYLHLAPWFHLADKGLQYKIFEKFAEQQQEIVGFFPKSFLLPSEKDQFLVHHKQLVDRGEKPVWISKPRAGANSVGITIHNNPDKLNINANVLIQRFISEPFLLQGRKFDLRVYVVVASIEPFRIYLAQQALAYLSKISYTNDPGSWANVGMQVAGGSNADLSLTMDLPQIKREMEEKGYDFNTFWKRVKEATALAMISSQELFVNHSRKLFPSHREIFFTPQILGFDILVDNNLKPWVIEINPGCGLLSQFPLKQKVYRSMIPAVWGVSTLSPSLIPYDGLSFEELRKKILKKLVKMGHSAVANEHLCSNTTGATWLDQLGVKMGGKGISGFNEHSISPKKVISASKRLQKLSNCQLACAARQDCFGVTIRKSDGFCQLKKKGKKDLKMRESSEWDAYTKVSLKQDTVQKTFDRRCWTEDEIDQLVYGYLEHSRAHAGINQAADDELKPMLEPLFEGNAQQQEVTRFLSLTTQRFYFGLNVLKLR